MIPDELPDKEELLRRYAHPEPEPGRSWVRGCMISSVDGSVAGPNHLAGPLSTPLDHAVYDVMRDLAQVLLIGVGTVRAEGYGPEVLAHRPMAVVTGSGDVSGTLVETGDPERLWVFTSDRCPPDRLAALRDRLGADRVLVSGDGSVALEQPLAAVRAAGLVKVLCEGGPTLLGQVAQRDLLDELCLTISPTLIGGDASRIVHGLSSVVRPLRLADLILSDSTLASRWLMQRKP